MDNFLTASAPAQASPLRPRAVLIDLALIVIAIAGSSLAVWAIARAYSSIPQMVLFLVVIAPYLFTQQAILRRECYPSTTFGQMCRWATISPADPIPAPLGRKLYAALLSGIHVGLATMLAYVIISRTWYAERVGPLQTSLVYDALHPWSVAPLYTQRYDPGEGRGKVSPPLQALWWVFPGMSILFPFLTLAWCGTIERNARLAHVPHTAASELVEPELSSARVAAVLSLLLVWLPVIGLIAGGIAYWVNRRSRGWRRRVSQACFFVSASLHVALVAVILFASTR
jgi:hypothetical protein